MKLYVWIEFHLCGRMDRHSFRAANVASTSPRFELGKVAFSSMVLKRKKSQRFGASSFSKFHHKRQKNPFATPMTVLQRAEKSLCYRSQFRKLFLPHRFIKIRLSHQRPVSIKFLTICRIPGFPKSEQNRKSCGNVQIWRKRDAVRRTNHCNLKCFWMKVVPNWYKEIPPDHFGRADLEISKTTGLSNKTSTALSCADRQILEHLIQNKILNISSERQVKQTPEICRVDSEHTLLTVSVEYITILVRSIKLYRSLLQKRPVKEKIFCKRDL